MATDVKSVAVVMVPLPLQGHLNQLLHLSRLLSAHDIAVHFVSTATHNLQANLRVHGWNPLSISNIHFHDLPNLSFATSPPPNNPNSTTNFPSHLLPLCEAAAAQLRGPVAALLRKLTTHSRRLVVIHDSLMGSVIQDFVSLPNTESYTFHSVSAFAIALYASESINKQLQTSIDFEFDEQPLAFMEDLSFEGCFTSEFKSFIAAQYEFTKLNSGRIYNTCRVIEQPILELLETEERNRNKRLWALGPFHPIHTNRELNDIHADPVHRHRCLRWLDKQAPKSVILVSFGTTTSFTQEQILEIAIGLEKSKEKFIWVLLDADRDNVRTRIEIELPKEYEDKVEGRGLVVREWAPQLEILGHASIGGFMSHCGWNSCIESISMGVPMAAWPMHSDQPNNAVLVAKILKVGLEVKDWAVRRDSVVVAAAAVEKGVRRLMGSEEGEEIRRRAGEIGGRVRKSVRDGGVSQIELESFIAHITR